MSSNKQNYSLKTCVNWAREREREWGNPFLLVIYIELAIFHVPFYSILHIFCMCLCMLIFDFIRCHIKNIEMCIQFYHRQSKERKKGKKNENGIHSHIRNIEANACLFIQKDRLHQCYNQCRCQRSSSLPLKWIRPFMVSVFFPVSISLSLSLVARLFINTLFIMWCYM